MHFVALEVIYSSCVSHTFFFQFGGHNKLFVLWSKKLPEGFINFTLGDPKKTQIFCGYTFCFC